MSMLFRGKVAIEQFEAGRLFRFQQKRSNYVHNAIFKGLTNGENTLPEALFVYRSFRDEGLRTFKLPLLGRDRGSGYIDFYEVEFDNGSVYYGERNGEEGDNDYYTMWRRLDRS